MFSDGFVKDVAECKDYADAVQDFLTALKISGAINIDANSFGSRVEQCFAIHYPERVTRIAMTGTGVGPMVGFLRRLRAGRGAELYFGARDPGSDYLYAEEMEQGLKQGRLSRLTTAFSRVRDRAYVQDRLRADAAHLRGQILKGGQVLVCGSIAMARAVADEVEAALAPAGLSVAALRAEGRYLEDVY